MLSFFGQTDIGKRRALNEDSIFAADNLFLVCDGMGGHKAGEVASQLAVERIASFVARSVEDEEITWPYGFDTRATLDGNRLRTAIKLANRAVARKGGSSDEYTGMGTTVAAVLVSKNRPLATYANVGDSRIYLIRDHTITQITHDDSWANLPWKPEEVDASITKKMHHVLTKALGASDDVSFDVKSQELIAGDILLLCSDGLTNMLPDDRILTIVSSNDGDAQRACDTLIAHANTEGGRDNISAVVVRYS